MEVKPFERTSEGCLMLISTKDAVYRLGVNQDTPGLLFEGERVVCVAQGAGFSAIALSEGVILFISGKESQRITSEIEQPIESLLVLQENPKTLLIGTEGPHLYRLGDDGSVQRIPSFDALECRENWYTPWGGPPAIRSLASTRDGWVFADIHVGSIMRSQDGGDSWEPVTPDLHEDVHQVATCPEADHRLYANTADAVYISEDRGGSWVHRSKGLKQRYGRAIAVHPRDPDCLLASVSDGPTRTDARGKLYRTDDAGKTWTHVTKGFPASTEGNIDTFHIAFSPEGTAWAVVDAGLYRSRDRGKSWERFFESPQTIVMISCESSNDQDFQNP